MNKKICIITGANAGIGKQASIQMMKKGYHVILACRNEKRGNQTLAQIKKTINSQDAELMIVDMSSQSSIRNFAEAFLNRYNTLDVLIHNAANFDISVKKPVLTNEGIESIWATNHLGPVLLTHLLLDCLKNSTQSRVITIASKGLITMPFLKINFNDPEFKNHKFDVAKAYYQSKLAQIMYNYWLAEHLKETNITVNCIRVTNVKIDVSRYQNISKLSMLLYNIKSRFSISAHQMAKTYIYLATSESLSNVTGKYFNEKNKIILSNRYSRDINNIDKLMNLTLEYLKK